MAALVNPERHLALIHTVNEHHGVLMVEPDGVVESPGGHLGDVTLPLFAMYAQGVTRPTGRANNGPYIRPTLALLRQGVVKPSMWSQPFPWSQAAEVLREPALKPLAVRERISASRGEL